MTRLFFLFSWSIGFAFSLVLFAGEGEAASHLYRVSSGADLQNQVKATAIKVIPAVVSIASTVMVRDQAFSDETLPFGLLTTHRRIGKPCQSRCGTSGGDFVYCWPR